MTDTTETDFSVGAAGTATKSTLGTAVEGAAGDAAPRLIKEMHPATPSLISARAGGQGDGAQSYPHQESHSRERADRPQGRPRHADRACRAATLARQLADDRPRAGPRSLAMSNALEDNPGADLRRSQAAPGKRGARESTALSPIACSSARSSASNRRLTLAIKIPLKAPVRPGPVPTRAHPTLSGGRVPHSSQRTSRRTTSRAAFVRPDKENCKCQRTKRKSIC